MKEDGIPGPRLEDVNIWREARAVLDMISIPLSWPLLMNAPRGDRHPILVIPGYAGDDSAYYPLHLYLRLLGYRSYGWLQGRNRGPTPNMAQRLAQRLRDIRREADGRKVSLIGQSLGGIYARELARRYPSSVRQVVTLGAPVNDPFASRILREARSKKEWADFRVSRRVLRRLRTHLPMPCTSIYSRSDGVVSPESAQLEETPLTQNVHIESSHTGMGFNSLAYYVIADRLAHPIEEWEPFEWPLALRWLAELSCSARSLVS